MLNPVLRREMRTSLRNWRIFGGIALYVLLMGIGAGIFLYGTMFASYDFSFDPQSTVALYGILCAIQMAFVLLATPAQAAASISGERERQTLDLLLVTKMSQFSIVIGKLLSSLGIILLMIFATLPIFAIVFYFGGVSFFGLLGMMAYVLMTAVMAGCISVFMSCIFKRTMISIVLVYLLIGILCFGTLIAVALYYSVYWSMYQQEPGILFPLIALAGNPGVAFFSILDGQLGTGFVREVLRLQQSQSGLVTWVVEHYWAVNVIVQVAISGLFLALATYFVNPVRGRKK